MSLHVRQPASVAESTRDFPAHLAAQGYQSLSISNYLWPALHFAMSYNGVRSTIDFKSYRWQRHCRGPYQTPTGRINCEFAMDTSGNFIQHAARARMLRRSGSAVCPDYGFAVIRQLRFCSHFVSSQFQASE